MADPVLTLPAAALSDGGGPAPLLLLGERWALRYEGLLTSVQCAALTAGVYRARAHWVPSFSASQFSLGRAFYTDLEQDRTEEYFATARRSDLLVRRSAPGLQEGLLRAAAALCRAPVSQRPGWCGPGVHIFPAGAWVAESGGEVHFDIEGLPDETLTRRAPALTLVLVLQPAERGGGLRLWDLRYDGADVPADAPPAGVCCVTVPYQAGDLVVIESYRLHQIEPFSGPSDRVSATVHAVHTGDATWEAWF